MISQKPNNIEKGGQILKRIGRVLMLLFALMLMMLTFGPRTLQAATSTITLEVIDYDTGLAITPATPGFTYLVNEDNTGDPTSASKWDWPSLSPMASHSPVLGLGTVVAGNTTSVDLDDPGRYLISVRADGYKLGGIHVTDPVHGSTVTVELVKEESAAGGHPDGLPLATIRIHVFEDNWSTNGEDDIPLEHGLEGFRVFIEDAGGLVIVNALDDPICTEYDGSNNPIPGTGGECYTDANGDVVVQMMWRNKYEILAKPPIGEEARWVQTTTIEGTHVIDAWVDEGNDGYGQREGFQAPMVWVGFVDSDAPSSFGAGAGSISGTVKTFEEWIPPTHPLILTEPMDQPWVAVTDLGTDQLVHLERGNPDGSFDITGVPDGVYQLAIWDAPLDYIMNFRTVTIPDDPANPNDTDADVMTAELGEFGVPRWFGWFSGEVFLDDGDGIKEPGETLLPLVELLMRYRDGSIKYATFTDGAGYYEFPEVFELEKFYVTEVGFGHLGFTGALVHSEFDDYDHLDPSTYDYIEGALTVPNLNWGGKRSTVDWGKVLYTGTENGGISGIVQYATTRNEFEARLQATEDYEPGMPNVGVQLWDLGADETSNTADDILLNVTETDAFTQPTDCDVTDYLGVPISDLVPLGPTCVETPNLSNEVKEGVFDGGYAFEESCLDLTGLAVTDPTGDHDTDTIPNSADPDLLLPEGSCEALVPDDYMVQVIPPDHFKIVTEEDLNTAEGNDLTPAIPAGACVGDMMLMDVPDEYSSPFDGVSMPLCDKRQVTVQAWQNVGLDFYLMTDFEPGTAVPIPGRIFGFLLDDLNVETDPEMMYYGEKRGIPNTPVGIRDFTGRLITTLHSDENGIFEVLLPSTYVADCATPAGVCPQMYAVVGNDPGDPDAPNANYNPNYQTITFLQDVWPGKTTFADVALFPITSFVEFPGGQGGQPAACQLADTIPQVQVVDPPYNESPMSTIVTISGENLGVGLPTVEFTNSGGTTTSILASAWVTVGSEFTVDVAALGFDPYQMLVRTATGELSMTGITFHKIGGGFGGYSPTVVTVTPPAIDPLDPVIQTEIDGAGFGLTLIVVEPGLYYGAVNLNEWRIKLQGYGPGANDGFGTGGSVIDERFVQAEVAFNAVGPYASFFPAQIDGFRIQAGRGEVDIGGGLHVDQNANGLTISNNFILSNGGNFGGGITVGEPYVGDNNNDNIRIHHNRINHNGGISLAGGLGIFNGADNYEIDHNQICGNGSGEYGGGISHFGLSHGGSIHHNEITYNSAFDEGGGVLIGGEQPLPPAILTDGSGDVAIYSNLIFSNISNDDGGGVRLLQPGDDQININNNMIVNNVATDLGGGISLDDASEVTIVNNTIARNVTTATAEDNILFLPRGAGIAAEPHSPEFAATLPGSDPGYPDPVMFNNIVCENQAYTWDGTALVLDSPDPFFDFEVLGGGIGDVMHPTNSLITDPADASEDFDFDASNGACEGILASLFDDPYATVLNAVAFNQEPGFITVFVVTVDLPATTLGDYHILAASAAETLTSLTSSSGVDAPCEDIDDEVRDRPDIGADEINNGGTAICGGPPPPGTLGVDVAPAQNVTGVSPSTVILDHTLYNTGDLDDSYDLSVTIDTGWTVSLDPSTPPSIFLTAGSNTSVEITVDVPASVLDGTVATVELTATSVADGLVTDTVVDTITIQDIVLLPAADFYLSLDRDGATLPGIGITVDEEDIIGFDFGTGDYVMVMDGSDVSIPNDVDAFDILADGSILMSFDGSVSGGTLPGLAVPVTSYDIVRFQPAVGGLGEATSGTFSLWLKGSDIGLDRNQENIDAISLREGDVLVISVAGFARVPVDTLNAGGPQLIAADEDLIEYLIPDEDNPGSGGTWSLYFDGSDAGVDLDDSNGEDVDAAYVHPDGISAHLSTRGSFTVPGLTGRDEDVFVCGEMIPGATTSCNYAFGSPLYFDGSANSISNGNGRDIDGIDLP